MRSISLVMTDCPQSGHVQVHVSNLAHFAIASRQCAGFINELIDGQLVDYTYKMVKWLNAQVYYTLVDCNLLTPLLRFVLDFLSKLFLHCYAAVGKNSTDASHRTVCLR